MLSKKTELFPTKLKKVGMLDIEINLNKRKEECHYE